MLLVTKAQFENESSNFVRGLMVLIGLCELVWWLLLWPLVVAIWLIGWAANRINTP